MKCGETRGKRPICDLDRLASTVAIHPEHRLFRDADHFDAYAVYQYIAQKLIDQFGANDGTAYQYEKLAQLHCDLLKRRDTFEKMKADAGIVTLPDLMRFAHKLVVVGYRKGD